MQNPGLKTIAILVLFVTSRTHAVVINFDGLFVGPQGNPVLTLSEATFTSFGDDLAVGAAGIENEICAGGEEIGCSADLLLEFNGLASNLSFVVSGFSDGDFVEAKAFDEMANLLATVIVNANGTFGFAGVSGINSVLFDDNSTMFGVAYDTFEFTLIPPRTNAIPASSTVGLLALGLFGYHRVRRRYWLGLGCPVTIIKG